MITSNNQLIERDATSSGVQIASALSRNAEMAAVVNLLPSNEQRDIYKVVAEMTNRKWAELGFDQRLVRGDTKRATIAIVYGGSHKTAYESLAETIGLSFNQAPDVFRAFWQSLSETMTGVMQVEKYITKLCNIIQQSGVHRLEFPVPTGGVCVFEAVHPTVRVRGQVKVAKARTDEEAAAEVDRSRDEIKDRVADSSMVTTYETHLPAGVKQFPGKSVTAAYIQGFDAAVLATTQLKLFEAGVQAWCKHDACLAALGPGRLEPDMIALIGETGHEFDGLLSSQTEGALQLQAHTHVVILDTRQCLAVDRDRLGLVTDELPVGDAVEFVRAGNDIAPIHFRCPPA